MIIWDKRDGYTYKDERDSKEYALYEMKCYKGECTSDCIAIWDEKSDCLANHVYGATFLDGDIAELDRTIKQYVDEYSEKCNVKEEVRAHTGAEVYYKTTKAGVRAWLNDVVDDILDREIYGDYIISHGNRYIQLPDLAEIHSLLEDFLKEAEEEANQ